MLQIVMEVICLVTLAAEVYCNVNLIRDVLLVYLTDAQFCFPAWETLGIPAKRKSYDSIDPQFDDSIPSNKDSSREKFFSVFKPAFDMNAR